MSAPLNQQKTILPVILAGGVGSRLWPLSRATHPKPFIKLDDGQSLIQKTYLRACDIENVKEIITVTNRELFFYTKDEYADIASSNLHQSFLLEPFGRNSTAAIATAAHYAKQKYQDDCLLLILPADHLIDNQASFIQAVMQACDLASEDKLVTFGIKPDAPKTSFGYIEADGVSVKRFVEKPDAETAQTYLDSGNFFWNSGMFCMSARVILTEMQSLCPDIASNALKSLENAENSTGAGWSQAELNAEYFEKIEDISIDYSIFEKSENVVMVPCDIGWSDIGSWNEFGALHPQDAAGNHICGEVMLDDVTNCIVHSESRLVAGLGLDNLIIADTVDALLIAHKDSAQDVRKIVGKLKANGNSRYQLFPTVHRPWGTYTVLLEGEGFKLKRIEVKPGGRLSLQSHKHRNEHWVIVSGIAKITNGDKILELNYNQSTYIPVGNKHRLENTTEEMLTLIEVQCGNYLGEDDIIRYEDTYGRVACSE